MRKNVLLIAALMAVLALPACVQQQPAPPPAPSPTPIIIRGTVDGLNGQSLVVNMRGGGKATIALASNYVVRAVVRRPLGSIKPGDYVASTSVKGADGKLHAVEVHIFPEASRGVGEGQRPADLMPNSLMTNATVGKVTKTANGGRVLTVTYKGQSSDVIVGPKVPVVTYVPGDASLLKRGKYVVIFAQKYPDGSLTSRLLNAEKNGVKPPM
ncbi:MAG: hypothetical protein ABSG66_02170 [Stellaceae bacterium]|jgi:hypothetical protein